MILLTRLDGSRILANERFLELVEETPDTIVTMQNGHRYVVQESVEQILILIRDFQEVLSGGEIPESLKPYIQSQGKA